jgi:hypothetical protein
MSMDVSTKQGLMRHLIEVHELAPHQVRMGEIEFQHDVKHQTERCDHSVDDTSYPVSYESHQEGD